MLTAVDNDVGFAHIYTRQIIAQGKKSDAVIGISTGGNSENLINAFDKAKEISLTTIGLAGGNGGKKMRDLIEDVFLGAFHNPLLAPLEDQAVMNLAELAKNGDRLAFTTDGYVVSPLFFAGGNIGMRENVKGACEILGLDPLYLANEGKLLAIVPPDFADTVLKTMREHPAGREAAILGEVVANQPGIVLMNTVFGGARIVDLLVGEQLPANLLSQNRLRQRMGFRC